MYSPKDHIRVYTLPAILLTRRLFCSQVDENGPSKLVKVAVVGDPNAGKSSLVNALLGRRVNSVSRKVHTTRRNTLAVLNDGETQMVFVDTPGFVSSRSSARRELEKSLLVDPYLSVHGVDVVVVVHDADNFYTKHRLSAEVVKALRFSDDETKTVLSLSKVDLVKDRKELLTLTAALTKAPNLSPQRQQRTNLSKLFDSYERSGGVIEERPLPPRVQQPAPLGIEDVRFDQVFMTSSLHGVGLQPLKEYILSQAKSGPWLHDGGFITDQSDEEMVALCVKEKLLDTLTEEIPYQVQPSVDFMSEDECGVLTVQVSLCCHSKRLASAVMGKAGQTVRSVALAAELSLSEAFNRAVQLKLVIKLDKTSSRRDRAVG